MPVQIVEILLGFILVCPRHHAILLRPVGYFLPKLSCPMDDTMYIDMQYIYLYNSNVILKGTVFFLS